MNNNNWQNAIACYKQALAIMDSISPETTEEAFDKFYEDFAPNGYDNTYDNLLYSVRDEGPEEVIRLSMEIIEWRGDNDDLFEKEEE
jgi:hypothetical protein